jgi:hypothetical protein
MRVIREIEVAGGRKVLIKELTLGDLRAWLAECARSSTTDLVDEVFADQDLLVSDLPAFCDLATTDLEGLAPSEIAPVVQAIREVNERFFVIWRRRLAAVMGAPATPPAALPEPSQA